MNIVNFTWTSSFFQNYLENDKDVEWANMGKCERWWMKKIAIVMIDLNVLHV